MSEPGSGPRRGNPDAGLARLAKSWRKRGARAGQAGEGTQAGYRVPGLNEPDSPTGGFYFSGTTPGSQEGPAGYFILPAAAPGTAPHVVPQEQARQAPRGAAGPPETQEEKEAPSPVPQTGGEPPARRPARRRRGRRDNLSGGQPARAAAEPAIDSAAGSAPLPGTQPEIQDDPPTPLGSGQQPPGRGRGRPTTFEDPDGGGGHEDPDLTGDEARRAHAEYVRAADPGTPGPEPPEADEVVEAELVDEGDSEGSPSPVRARAQTKDHAIEVLAAGRRKAGLQADRIEDDDRWKEAYRKEMAKRYRPPDDPAQLSVEDFDDHIIQEGIAMTGAAAAANKALPPKDLAAYARYGEYPQPQSDFAIREALHLDGPGPTPADITAFRDNNPEKAERHADYLRFLERRAQASAPQDAPVDSPTPQHHPGDSVDLQDGETVTVELGPVDDTVARRLSREDALLNMKEHREELGLSDRMTDDPRWLAVFNAIYDPPEVEEDDPAKMTREKIQAWVVKNARSVQSAAEAATMVLPEAFVEAYSRYGLPYDDPAQDPAVRAVLHLDEPRGPRTPEGDPAVTDTLTTEGRQGVIKPNGRRASVPSLADLSDVTVHVDDIARLRELYPERAAFYDDFLADLEAQGIHEARAYPRYRPVERVGFDYLFTDRFLGKKPWELPPVDQALFQQIYVTGEGYIHASGPELAQIQQEWAREHPGEPMPVSSQVFVPDPVLEQIKWAWQDGEDRNWNASTRPPKFRDGQPEPERPGLRQRLYAHEVNRQAGRTRQNLHPRFAQGKLVFDENAQKWTYKLHPKAKIGKFAHDLHKDFRDVILDPQGQGQDSIDAKKKKRRSRRYMEHYRRMGYHREGRALEDRLRARYLRTEDGELKAGDLWQARLDAGRARRANKHMHVHARNLAHQELFPHRSNPAGTAHRQGERVRPHGDPRVRPAFETPQQRRARRTRRNWLRVQEFRANQRARDAASTTLYNLRKEKENIKEELKDTTPVWDWGKRRALHSRLNAIKRELKHARARAFALHPVVRAAAKGIDAAGWALAS